LLPVSRAWNCIRRGAGERREFVTRGTAAISGRFVIVEPMRAITLSPGVPASARLEEVAEPPLSDGPVLVRALALGICRTDHEIMAGEHGAPPANETRLILGHESLGVVMEAPPQSGLYAGDHVVGIVRRPDPLPCPACAAGEWDMCRNGLYTERGIKARHGFGSERYRLEPDFTVKVDPALGLTGVLLEPASIVAKAWQHVARIGARTSSWRPQSLLVTGGGPIGLLAALMGRQRGLDLHLLERQATGPKSGLIRGLGARHHVSFEAMGDRQFDVVMECTAAPSVIAQAIARCAPSGIVCLLGVSAPAGMVEFDMGGLNRTVVLNNQVVVGSVNANRSHYDMAAAALASADRSWLDGLITRRVPLARWHDALVPQPGDVKVVIEFT
jgi:threonine dehydrogenase-like Zn-dependent dehydrogenase